MKPSCLVVLPLLLSTAAISCAVPEDYGAAGEVGPGGKADGVGEECGATTVVDPEPTLKVPGIHMGIPTVLDLDGDGSDEMIVLAPNKHLRIYELPLQSDSEPLVDVPGQFMMHALGDLDGDGLADLALAQANHIRLYRGPLLRPGRTSLGVSFMYIYGRADAIAIDDFDEDGHDDLLLAPSASLSEMALRAIPGPLEERLLSSEIDDVLPGDRVLSHEELRFQNNDDEVRITWMGKRERNAIDLGVRSDNVRAAQAKVLSARLAPSAISVSVVDRPLGHTKYPYSYPQFARTEAGLVVSDGGYSPTPAEEDYRVGKVVGPGGFTSIGSLRNGTVGKSLATGQDLDGDGERTEFAYVSRTRLELVRPREKASENSSAGGDADAGFSDGEEQSADILASISYPDAFSSVHMVPDVTGDGAPDLLLFNETGLSLWSAPALRPTCN